MTTQSMSLEGLRRELRAAMGNRGRLSTLHSVITEQINTSYGEEKAALLRFRQEVRDALNCRTLSPS